MCVTLFTEKRVERRHRLISQRSMRHAEGPEGLDLQKLFREALTQSKNVCTFILYSCKIYIVNLAWKNSVFALDSHTYFQLWNLS